MPESVPNKRVDLHVIQFSSKGSSQKHARRGRGQLKGNSLIVRAGLDACTLTQCSAAEAYISSSSSVSVVVAKTSTVECLAHSAMTTQ